MSNGYGAFIGGEWTTGHGAKTFEVYNPANGEVMADVSTCTLQDVDEAVDAARESQQSWASLPVSERSKLLRSVSRLVTEHQDELALLNTLEQGSPIRKSRGMDIPLTAEFFEYYAGIGRGLTGDSLPVGPWCTSFTVREPLGVVGMITPWNFPTVMAAWKLGAALVTGNTAVIKPASVTPLTTLKIAELCTEAGIPAGVVNVVTGPGSIVGEALVSHKGVNKISFTGDTSTGKRIMSVASATVKPVGLELGGKNAMIVLPDADIEAAVEGALFAGFFNSGQQCAASSRLVVHNSVHDEFVLRLVAKARALRVGDPMNPDTVLGPVPFAAHRDRVEAFIERAVDEGARLALGGKRPETVETRNGFFIAPTILTDVTNDMEIMQDEVFGPVVGICRFSDPMEAVAIANDSVYGLCASLWTRDLRLGLDLTRRLDVGTVWLNEHAMITCETPWGGCKESGFGKDSSHLALEDFTKVKHVYIDMHEETAKPWYQMLT